MPFPLLLEQTPLAPTIFRFMIMRTLWHLNCMQGAQSVIFLFIRQARVYFSSLCRDKENWVWGMNARYSGGNERSSLDWNYLTRSGWCSCTQDVCSASKSETSQFFFYLLQGVCLLGRVKYPLNFLHPHFNPYAWLEIGQTWGAIDNILYFYFSSILLTFYNPVLRSVGYKVGKRGWWCWIRHGWWWIGWDVLSSVGSKVGRHGWWCWIGSAWYRGWGRAWGLHTA